MSIWWTNTQWRELVHHFRCSIYKPVLSPAWRRTEFLQSEFAYRYELHSYTPPEEFSRELNLFDRQLFQPTRDKKELKYKQRQRSKGTWNTSSVWGKPSAGLAQMPLAPSFQPFRGWKSRLHFGMEDFQLLSSVSQGVPRTPQGILCTLPGTPSV